jgi:antitoxin MazE
MNVTLNLQKWGNSNGVRLPKKILDAAGIKPQQSMTVTLKGDSIVLTPIRPKNTYTLEAMLKDATPERVGGELDWGPDVGEERIEY